MRKTLPRETIQLGDESTSLPKSSQRVQEIDRSVVIDGAYDEYRRRRDNHESVDIHEFCQQYSQVYHSLVRQIEVEEYLRENPLVAEQALQTAWPELGEVFFGCQISEEIGRGTFARVYLCSQPELGNRSVVLKIARGGAYEAKTMGRLTHANIMPVFSVEQSESHELSGICMPFLGRSTLLDVIDGDDSESDSERNAGVILDAAIRWQKSTDRYAPTNSTTLTAEESYEFGVSLLMAQVAEGLAHAHGEGVIHGDLKPTNVVLSSEAVPYIVDFNLANDCNSDQVLTGGTLAYMSPEQVQSIVAKDKDFKTTKQCDVFSFGVILHQLVHGELPFALPDSSMDQSERFETYLQQFTRDRAVDVPAHENDIDQLIEQCLKQAPAERPTMSTVAAELRAITEGYQQPTKRFSWIRTIVQISVWATIMVSAAFTLDKIQDWFSPDSINKSVDMPLADIKAMLVDGQIDAATELLREKLASSPDSNDIKFLLAQANAAIFHHRYDEPALREARHLLISLTARDRTAVVSEWTAFCHLGDKNYDSADQIYERLIAAGDASASSWNNLGVICEKRVLELIRGPTLAKLSREEGSELLSGLRTKEQECYRNAMEADSTRWVPCANLLKTYKTKDNPSPWLLSLAEKAATGSNHRPQLCGRAAQIAATLHSLTSDSQYKEKALHYLRLAAAGGLDVKPFVRDRGFDSIRDEEEFSTLLADCKTPTHSPPAIKRTMLPDFAITCEKEQASQ